MRKAPNLYGDLGYWSRLVNGDARAAERLQDLLTTELSPGLPASKRLMFGTDWFMLTNNPGFAGYVRGFQAALQHMGIGDDVLNELFADNARRLFKL